MNLQINTLEAVQNSISQEVGIIVYFYSDRCPPCISLRPKIRRLIEEDFPKMNLLFINSESDPSIPAHFEVFANPCIIIFFEGLEFGRYSKFISISQLGNDLNRLYSLIFKKA